MNTIEKYSAQRNLLIVWLLSSLFVLIIFMLMAWPRTTNATFSDTAQWLFNYLSPGLTLIIGAFVYSARTANIDKIKQIDKIYFRITLCFCVVYLTTIAICILLVPIILDGNTELIIYLKNWNVILSFLQTSVIALLGIFFTKEN